MQHFKSRSLLVACLISLIFILTACHHDDKSTLKVGTISGPETELMEVAKQVAAKEFGLTINIVEFSDYLLPNMALNEGSLDANMFQHAPYLTQQINDHGFKLVSIAKTFIYPMGIYSRTITHLADLKPHALVSIPNDPSNEGRALLLLEKAGLIELTDDHPLSATPSDLKKNPLQLQFRELDAAQLARSLSDVDLSLINTNYAIPAGLSPKKDAIFLEDQHSPYANIIVARETDLNDPRLKQLIKAVQSEAVLEKAQSIFKAEAIPAWDR